MTPLEGPKIYVAGPLTQGDQFANVARAIAAGEALGRMGAVPFVPHLSFAWHMQAQRSWEWWVAWCLRWVESCDGVVRLPGESKGATLEVAHAVQAGIPVRAVSLDALHEDGPAHANLAEWLRGCS